MKVKKLLALLLAMVMVLSVAAPAALAEDDAETEPPVVETTEDDAQVPDDTQTEEPDGDDESSGEVTEEPGDDDVEIEEPETPGAQEPETPPEGTVTTPPAEGGDDDGDGDNSGLVTPDDPENPDNPDDPENPDNPENPGAPENPDDPENPENPPVEGETPPVEETVDISALLSAGTLAEFDALYNALENKEQLTEEQIADLNDKRAELEEKENFSETEDPEATALVNRLLATTTLDEYYAILNEFPSLEELNALGAKFTMAQWESIVAHEDALRAASDGTAQEPDLLTGVAVTEAGPLVTSLILQPSGGPKKVPKRTNSENWWRNDDAVEATKKITNWDSTTGTGTIQIEAFVTGQVTSTTTTTTPPIDIVLVIDQSGSMNFTDYPTDNGGVQTRQQAMKDAVKEFIKGIEDPDNGTHHRMAMVTFSSSATKVQLGGDRRNPEYWLEVTGTETLGNKNTLINTVNGFSANGATGIDKGMTAAQELLNARPGDVTGRQKVVVVFTDGAPTTGSNFEIAVADRAIATAKALKGQDPATTIYTVGILPGADATEMYDKDCTGTIGSSWRRGYYDKSYGWIDLGGETAASNRFLNLLSSNYLDASSVGLKDATETVKVTSPGYVFTPCTHSRVGSGYREYCPAGCEKYTVMLSSYWGKYEFDANRKVDRTYYNYEINRNFTRNTQDDYYLSATNSTDLTNAFKSISESINEAVSKSNLGTNAVVKDAITQQFEINYNVAGATKDDIGSAVKLYTADCTGKTGDTYEFSTPQLITEVGRDDITIENNTVQVKGFDFAGNFVSQKINSDGTVGDWGGKKLIIEIPIKAKDDFWGGNQVPTNDPGNCGVYENDEADTPVESLKTDEGDGYESEKKDVALLEFKLKTNDANIYYGGDTPTADKLYDSGMLYVKHRGKTDFEEKPVAVDSNAWQQAYVNVSTTGAITGAISNTEDKEYDVSTTVMPKSTGTVSSVTANGKASVNIFKPVLNFSDVSTYLTVKPTSFADPEVAWKWNDIYSTDSGVVMVGRIPDLTYKYNDNDADATDDYDVSLTSVKIGDLEIPNTIYSVAHDPCYESETTKGAFIVHVFKPTVTFQDKTTYLGKKVSDVNFDEWGFKVGSESWTHENQENLPKPTGNAPTLSYEYKVVNENTAVKTVNGVKYYQDEANVAVTAKIGTTDVTSSVAFAWKKDTAQNPNLCKTENCEAPAEDAGYQFRLHLMPCELTVSKQVKDNLLYDANDTFMFTIKCTDGMNADQEMTIFIQGTGSKTISGLPIGTYTVKEDTSWSWRYTPNASEMTRALDGGSDSVTFTNTLTNDKWLTADATAVNTYGKAKEKEGNAK